MAAILLIFRHNLTAPPNPGESQNTEIPGKASARTVGITAAAILAMIPLTRSVFWGPMAVAIMGGLAVATVLTLMVVPALYAAWFKVQKTA